MDYTPIPAQTGVLSSVKAVSIDDALGAAGTRHTLGIVDVGTMNDYLGVFNSLAPLGTRLGVNMLGGNAIRISVNSYSGGFKQLTDIGIGDATFAKLKDKIISYSETQYKTEKYLNGDAIQLDANNLAKAIAWFGQRLTFTLRGAMIESRRLALAKIADEAGYHKALAPTATSEEIYNLVVGEALKYQSLKDESQGIQVGGIQSDNVTIYARPDAYAKVIGYRTIGNAAQQTFDLGVLSTSQIGGFKVVLEPALPVNTPWLIATDSTAFYDFLQVFGAVIQFETNDIAQHCRVREAFGRVVDAVEAPDQRVGTLTAGSVAPATAADAFLASAIRYA